MRLLGGRGSRCLRRVRPTPADQPSVGIVTMGKALIIAEKPSVAGDIARALGGFQRKQDYFENDEYVISSAIGHLVEIVPPEGVEAKRGKWSFANLPVIPPHFDLQPIAKTESRLKLLNRLMRRKEVDQLINACDAGREGELRVRGLGRQGLPVPGRLAEIRCILPRPRTARLARSDGAASPDRWLCSGNVLLFRSESVVIVRLASGIGDLRT